MKFVWWERMTEPPPAEGVDGYELVISFLLRYVLILMCVPYWRRKKKIEADSHFSILVQMEIKIWSYFN